MTRRPLTITCYRSSAHQEQLEQPCNSCDILVHEVCISNFIERGFQCCDGLRVAVDAVDAFSVQAVGLDVLYDFSHNVWNVLFVVAYGNSEYHWGSLEEGRREGGREGGRGGKGGGRERWLREALKHVQIIMGLWKTMTPYSVTGQ